MRMHGNGGRGWLIGFLAVAAVAGGAGGARGAGFAIIEQSVSGLGNAFSGGAAGAEDATTVFFNPAGLTRLAQGQQAIAGVHLIRPSFDFKNDGSTHVLTPITGEGLTGDNGGDGGELAVAPNFFYGYNSASGWAVGLGVSAPFGLVTDYDKKWVGRYHALRSDVLTININPAVAYQVTDKLSIGGGVSAMYMEAELSNAIDFGTILVAFGGDPQRDDGKAKLNADDWSFGFNVGILYQFSESTRAGIHYRSRVKQELEGDAKFTVSDKIRGILASLNSGQFVNTGAQGDITLPDNLSLSLYHRYNPQLAVMADVTWTHWSTFDELTIEFDNPEQDPSTTTEDWNDSWRVSVGATYSLRPNWDLRCGLAYDQTPIPDAKHRTPRLPGEDRYWVALGTGYRVNEQLSFDFAYAHLFVDDAKINKDPVGEDEFRGGLKGEYEDSADILSAQVVFQW